MEELAADSRRRFAKYAVTIAGLLATTEKISPMPEVKCSDGQNLSSLSRQHIGACQIATCPGLWEVRQAAPLTQAHTWLTMTYPLGNNSRNTTICVSDVTYTRGFLRGLELRTHLDYRHNWRAKRWYRAGLMDSEPQSELYNPLMGAGICPVTACRSRINTDVSVTDEPRKTCVWERHLERFGNSGHSGLQGFTQLHLEIRDQDSTKKPYLALHFMVSVAPGP